MARTTTVTQTTDGTRFRLTVRRDDTGVVEVQVSCVEELRANGVLVSSLERTDIPIPAAVVTTLQTQFANMETAIKNRDYS